MSTLLIPRRRNRISLTALIDVVFILLMFFMLTSSFTRWQHLSLDSATLSASQDTAPPKVLLVDAAGTIQPLPAAAGTSSDWQSLWDQDTPIVVRPEANTPVQVLVDSLQAVRSAGYHRVNLGDAIASPSGL